MRFITAFFMAWGNFFAVPCPFKLWDNSLRRLQLIFFPMIGVLMGMLWYALYLAMAYVKLPLQLQTVALTVYPFLVSGFIHLDGFMDCSDAILSRRELEERQRILKDSHVGAFAVISTVILFLIFYSAVGAVLTETYSAQESTKWLGLIFIPVVSRIFSGYGVLKYQPMGHSQYVVSFDEGINKKYEILLGIMAIGAVGVGAYMSTAAALCAVGVGMAHYLMMRYARKQLGGMSGDVSGYALTISECVGMLVLAVL